MDMFNRLEDIVNRYEDITAELSNPDVVNDQNKFRSLMKEQNNILPIVTAFNEYKSCKQNIDDSLAMLNEESDEELLEMAKEELNSSKKRVEELENEIRDCGLYKAKAKNLLGMCHMLIENYGGEVPEDFDELVKLPGVGRKTANVVRSVAWGYPAIAVDTHVFRVANRLKLAVGTTPIEVEKGLMKAIPKKDWSDAHHWLIWHGRRVCTARKPACETCFLQDICPSCTVGKK